MAEKDEDVALDFLSPRFDPVRALHADPSAVRLPCPDIQPCDNLDAYDSVMRGVRRQASSGAAHEPATKKVEPAGGVAAVRAQRRFKSVLHFMECKICNTRCSYYSFQSCSQILFSWLYESWG